MPFLFPTWRRGRQPAGWLAWLPARLVARLHGGRYAGVRYPGEPPGPPRPRGPVQVWGQHLEVPQPHGGYCNWLARREVWR